MNETQPKSNTKDELALFDAVSLAKMIRDKELSPVEAVSMTIKRIESLDKDLKCNLHQRMGGNNDTFH